MALTVIICRNLKNDLIPCHQKNGTNKIGKSQSYPAISMSVDHFYEKSIAWVKSYWCFWHAYCNKSYNKNNKKETLWRRRRSPPPPPPGLYGQHREGRPLMAPFFWVEQMTTVGVKQDLTKLPISIMAAVVIQKQSWYCWWKKSCTSW